MTRTPSRRPVFWVLLITGIAGFMAALDNLVVTNALPSIRADLGGGAGELEWTVSAYTLTFAVLMLLGAALGDRFGRRRMFTAGVALFTLASGLAGFAQSIDQLIAARAVQGVGAAVMMPLILTLIAAAVPAGRRGMAYGITGAVNGLAVATGPLIGGTLTEHISWHWIFWVNVPLGVLLLVLAPLRLGESTAPGARLDLPGTLLVSGGLFGIVYALVNGNGDGWSSVPVLGGLLAGTALLAGFVVWELRSRRPMVPMRLFRGRAFSAINGVSLLMFLGMFGSIFLLSQALQLVRGWSPTEAGLRMLPWTAMPMVAAPIAGLLSDRFGGRRVVAAGLFLQGIALGWFAYLFDAGVSYGEMLPGMILGGVGMGLFFAPASALVMDSVRPAEAGIASGVNNAVREVGGALGIAVLSAVFTARGGYESVGSFVDGLTPALWAGTGGVLLGAVIALLIPRGGGAKPRPEPGAGEPLAVPDARVAA
ncbi:MFS transporter [Streptomyces sp. SID11385]|uniref:MFS transporter n=1 Tax=Streptomyces sp. SID11385 TaxID=2706031 RepID=UPI0013CDCE92|nr:MFS transporter [Streptomyces sp. SID11385]NEA39697.1 MFS transporter [Streptomyces sp. SID11385]